MALAMRKISKKLDQEQRKKTREDLFARNRRYYQMGQTLNTQNFKAFKSNLEIDPAYATIIEVFSRRGHDRNRILEYAALLEDEEIVRVYEGMVGLNSFGETLTSRETEEAFLGSGVVPRLISLAQIQGHDFLQQISLEVLKLLAKAVTGENLRAFFNSTILPINFFTEAIHLPKMPFYRVISLLQTLNERSNYMDSTDSNIPLLDIIDDCISGCFVPDETKEVARKLGLINRLLSTVKVHFWVNRTKFANRFYQIKQRMVQFYRRENLSDELCNQLRAIYDKQKIKAIADAIYHNKMDVPNVANYIRDLIHAGLYAKFSYSSLAFNCFMSTLISVKNTRCFVPHFQLLDRVAEIITTNYKDCRFSKRLEICIGIIFSLLQYGQRDLFQYFLSKRQLLNTMCQLYDISGQKKVIWQLNSIVRTLVTNCSIQRVMDVLREYKFVEEYFKNCLRFNQMTMKGALKYLMWSLSSLKRKNMQLYETIRGMVVAEQNYAVIAKIKSELTLTGIQQIFTFYDNLRDEEKPTIQPALAISPFEQSEQSEQSSSVVEQAEPIDVEQAESEDIPEENQVIQVFDESDDLAHDMSPGSGNHYVIDVDGIIVIDDY